MGIMQYEISNFAKPGFESKHNTKYWRLVPYLGIGKAHTHFGAAGGFITIIILLKPTTASAVTPRSKSCSVCE